MENETSKTPSLARQAGRAAAINASATAGMVGGLALGYVIVGAVANVIASRKNNSDNTEE